MIVVEGNLLLNYYPVRKTPLVFVVTPDILMVTREASDSYCVTMRDKATFFSVDEETAIKIIDALKVIQWRSEWRVDVTAT